MSDLACATPLFTFSSEHHGLGGTVHHYSCQLPAKHDILLWRGLRIGNNLAAQHRSLYKLFTIQMWIFWLKTLAKPPGHLDDTA